MSSPYSPRRLDDLKKKLQSVQAPPKLLVRSSSSSSRTSHDNSPEGTNSPIKRSSSESKLGPSEMKTENIFFPEHNNSTIPRGVTFHEDIQLSRNIEKDRQMKLDTKRCGKLSSLVDKKKPFFSVIRIS